MKEFLLILLGAIAALTLAWTFYVAPLRTKYKKVVKDILTLADFVRKEDAKKPNPDPVVAKLLHDTAVPIIRKI